MTAPAPVREATAPPERRGVARDGVRMLVWRPGAVAHRRFRDLPAELLPGDLLIVNTSATIPAALTARPERGEPRPLHVSAVIADGDWVVEVRLPGGGGPDLARDAGEVLRLPDGAEVRLLAPHPGAAAGETRLWRASVCPPVSAAEYLARHGRPIGYGYLDGPTRLRDHQTVFAAHPGSAEMPSAGRPFSGRLLARLVSAGVTLAPVLLHAGVSSPEAHEPPQAERFAVPADTARLAESARRAGRRVIAVGTTAARALESAASGAGRVRPASGWTDLVLGPDRPARVVDGLVTGLHEPRASHRMLIEAVAGPAAVAEAYAAVTAAYLWHEFGDTMLLLPGGVSRTPSPRWPSRPRSPGRRGAGPDPRRPRR
ncbi:MAG: S-adenosylmethionine:tRNA ribosyltransferase-isomerase [Thermoleophilia bacterium]|nr:S-adenosylmethionine:tRNA ribosyltransferase-isomerase [Thermoleophilia bacterium]